MIAALAVLALLQQTSAPQVMLAVDHDRVSPGEIVTLTIRVSSGNPDAISMNLPTLGGFELESRSERSDVTTGPAAGRTSTWELKLRATVPGEWRLGPIHVRQGSSYSMGDPVTVTIEGGAPAPVTATLSRRLAALIQRAPPPDVLGTAGITVALSDPVVAVGQQVDVVTIAWFDREVRQQLRRAPTVEEPQIDGVWSYPQPAPGGIAASRQVNGRWYDLFILHQVVFPLTAGQIAIPPAQLQYSIPLAFQFFSQEERYKLGSEPSSVLATALPDQGRDPTYVGAVGHGLVVSQVVTPTSGRLGEAFTVDLIVEGTGNVALWPQPDTRWPSGVRAYPEAAKETVRLTDGRLGGSKRFRFLLVADSAGSLALQGIRYAYFDPDAAKYLVATSSPVGLVVAPRGEAMSSRAEPPPMRLDLKEPLAVAVRQSLPDAVWWIIALLPLLVMLVTRLPRRGRVRIPPPSVSQDPLASAALRLAAALRSSRLDPEANAHLDALRTRLEALRFDSSQAGGTEALLAEIETALGPVVLVAPGAGSRWRQRAGVALVVCLTGFATTWAQTVPEQLYEAGAFRAAADGFRRRAVLSPDVTTHWYNLGDAAYRAGEDATALAAWVRAARLSPRDHSIRRAVLLVAPADAASGRSLWVSPVIPAELWLIGLVAWLGGWCGVLISRRVRGRWMVLFGGGILLLGAASALDRWYQRPIAIVAQNGQLRLSPHELAPAVGEVARLSTVVLGPGPGRGAWVRVESSGGQLGWMRRDELESVASAAEP